MQQKLGSSVCEGPSRTGELDSALLFLSSVSLLHAHPFAFWPWISGILDPALSSTWMLSS